MTENSGVSYLKNALEINLIKRFIQGSNIVDIGASKATLPLLDMGATITAIDTSRTIFPERKKQEDTRINLQCADIAALPCEAASFDSAVSLSVLEQAAHWREMLLHWKKFVRPGGRMLFGMHSQDNVIAAYGNDEQTWPEALSITTAPERQEHYVSRLTLAELHQFADEAAMTIVAVVPYAALCSTNGLIYECLECKNYWQRSLSWLAQDTNLFELALFLEEKLVAYLTPRMSGRLFVVLDNQPDRQANAAFMQRMAEIDAAIDQHTFTSLLPWLPLSQEEYSAHFGRLLQPLRARGFFLKLMKTLLEQIPAYNLQGLMPQELATTLHRSVMADQINHQAMKIIEHWSEDCHFRFYHGVDVTAGLGAKLIEDMMFEYFQAFSKET